MGQENSVIQKMAKRIISEITSNIQRSDTPNLICSFSQYMFSILNIWNWKHSGLQKNFPKWTFFPEISYAHCPALRVKMKVIILVYLLHQCWLGKFQTKSKRLICTNRRLNKNIQASKSKGCLKLQTWFITISKFFHIFQLIFKH